MTSEQATYARVIRRETHSPRSGLAIVLAVILILVCAWLGTEIVLALLGRPALLVAPVDMGRGVVAIGRYPTVPVIIAGVIVAIIGLILVVVSVSAGRRARHVLPSQRSAIVVDDEVIASALARQASYAGNIDPDDVEVRVSRRSASVRIRPTSGQSVDKDAIEHAVTEMLERYQAAPALHARVSVQKEAKVGA
ncbi:hypothetical protein E3T54_12575 [Cryobacterium sp. Sr8]|uniref:DNA/RNA endonuclease G n=1 Tax=Cryobacterium tagatosivorans TaxID=1259199 RepID=A0A4R8UIY1_9MICO|nr:MULTISPECIES: DUF6286 domain-containing protein [Cryobacterium]TFB54434.1 hypothetical protein E3O23_03765 [Cryobacterium tagatosivorans]TFD75277.1 hypothetical protein E3T54_12575 [Cryobacterium sp. Sr8]